MYSLLVNGQIIEAVEDKKLMVFLREDCNLKSVKDGCSEGACGTCTILVDGKPIKACVQKISRFEGKSIITVEGLSEREKEIYTYAFGEAGAVQCGFCIPGMIMCAKGLLDQNPNPDRHEIAKAIKNNICRCTGYKKIIDGIELAGKLLKEEKIPEAEGVLGVGKAAHRIDVREKVLGYGEYVDDMVLEGMIYGSAVRSAYPRAKVLSIDISRAQKLPGIRGVVTAEDIPGTNQIGHVKKDWDTLIPVGGITRYLGDAVCLVAGDTPEIVEEAKKLIEVKYEELPAVFSPEEAMKPDAPKVHSGGNILAHEHIKRGDADRAIRESAHVVTKSYETPFTEHAFLEPECAIAIVNREDGEAIIYSTDQSAYSTQHECADMLGYPHEKVHVMNKLVGGGFGGKEDMSVQHHGLLLSWYTGKPVKVKLSRSESILIHPKRHAAKMEFTTACDAQGKLTGMKATLITDTGAYASLGGPVLQRACTHAAGPYNYQNIDMEGTAVYTNNPPAGAFRGFGVTQTCFATECNLNLLAEMVGISPWEIRYRNAIRPGQELPNGQLAAPGTALVETLEAVKPIFENHDRAGIACAMKNAGVGVGLPDYGRCRITVEDGKMHIRTGATCIGQGLGTVLVQMCHEATGIDAERIVYHASETNRAPDSGVTSGSRQTLVTGEATRRACVELVKDLKNQALEALNGKEYFGEYLAATDPMGSPKKNPVSHVAYGYATQVVLLDETGRVESVAAAHDVGRAINPLSVEGQIEGGVVMSLGYALTEDYPLKEGKPTAKFGTLGLFRADKTPDVKSIIIEKNKDSLAFGAIGIGEITSIPTAPAVQGAYYKYDGVFRTKLPLEGTAYRK
ncbi:aldehyde oxidoreductase [Aequitasia blattaphilus]|uniref:Selenium-dependent xanthine dehydrogenase n=1 Tax=Aequitasia blattaphilus TaxID=2949332 RepID=A0ABT1E9A0_9FIRM|nr:selenium-dependent xanthine dehydrogenase [Aequitasia blattaphilus]MCP1102402.1 selenium-dependent xanthine dehydrogenase [Aequitasia blattaphilus]MCR8615042.1 selenium-dependent xanthine dehydrogenase [Aequitasia blattaphilus]